MSKLHRRLASLEPGNRILAGSRHSTWPVARMTAEQATRGLRLLTVEASDGDGIALADEDGTRRTVELDRDGKPTDWRDAPVWTDALPAGSPEAVKAYAAVLLAGEGDALLLHVESVEGDRAVCRLVQPASMQAPDESGGLTVIPDEDAEAWSGEIVGNAALWAHPILLGLHETPAFVPTGLPASPPPPAPPAWRVGDLVGAVGIRCAIEDGATVATLKGPVPIANLDRKALGSFMPWGVTERDVPLDDGLRNRYALARYSGPAGFEAYREAEELARVRLEPSEALVVWYKPVGNDPSDDATACSFMGMSGIAFHRVDSVEDYFHGAGIEEGLWVLRDAKGWSHRSYEGEYDSGIDGDWVPATPEDLARFGFDPESASAEIADRIEVDPRPDLATEMMAKAEAAAEANRTSPPGP